MNTEQIITSRYDDVIFENRNKDYGAYLIRRSYDSNLSKSTFVSFLFVACLFGGGYAAMMMKSAIPALPTKPPIDLSKEFVIIPEHKDPPPQAKQEFKHKGDLATKVVTHEVEPPPVDVPTTTPTGTVDGPEVPGVNNSPIGINTEPVQTVSIEQPKTLDFAEVMPEFEGGMKAMYKFLRKTLRYPAASRRVGEEGVVFVRFVVDVTGAITGIEVIKSVGASLDKEATRVIALMPQWKPGKQHGSPVNVRMTLPIKFEINKE